MEKTTSSEQSLTPSRKFPEVVAYWQSMVGQTVEGTVFQVSDVGDACIDVAANVRGILRFDRYPDESRPTPGETMKLVILSAGKDLETPKHVLLWFTRTGLSIEDKIARTGFFDSGTQMFPCADDGFPEEDEEGNEGATGSGFDFDSGEFEGDLSVLLGEPSEETEEELCPETSEGKKHQG